MLRPTYVILSVSAALSLAILAWGGRGYVAWLLRHPVFLGTAAIMVMVTLYYVWYVPRRWAHDSVRKAGDREVHVRFDLEGFQLEVPGQGFARHDWGEVEFARETRRIFHLHFARDLSYYVPKRAFRGDDLDQARRVLVERRLLR